jgi:hypothetical protein
MSQVFCDPRLGELVNSSINAFNNADVPFGRIA